MLVVLFLCLGVGAQRWDDAQHAGAARNDDDDVDFDDYYDEEDILSTTALTQIPRTPTGSRVRRYGDPGAAARTLSDDEIREVKGVLKEIMSGRSVKELTTATVQLLSTVDRATRSPAFTGLTRSSMGALTRSSGTDPTKFYENLIEEIIDNARRQGAERGPAGSTGEVPIGDASTGNSPTYEGFLEESDAPVKVLTTGGTVKVETWVPYKNFGRTGSGEEVIEGEEMTEEKAGNTTSKADIPPTVAATTATEPAAATTTTEPAAPTTRRTRRTRRKTTTTTTPKEVIDIETLVEIIANLTLDYELINITDLFNKTLLNYNIPKCLAPPESTTLTTSTTTTEEPMLYDLANATIISKCFVCGLETPGIPNNAYCADAFAGDFLPLVPVDPMARGQIARYRKYCRFLDVPGVLQNETQPRSVYGRWTGGCSVRWIDLSGVYTQRACRNRRRAVMGQHFVSKRMAKLEMALTREDNGCIISPMSSLVPLSRGISLYARFHACVCTGNWCNVATRIRHLGGHLGARLAGMLWIIVAMTVSV